MNEKKMTESGAMGNEPVTVRISLTDAEKEGFLSSEKYDSKHYWWEFDGNELTITNTEDV